MNLAIEMSRYGGPGVLEAVERPSEEPGPGEVIVETIAAAVNRADLFIRSGEWPIRGSFPYVPGLETCGRIARIGAGVEGFVEGDVVITMMQRLGGIHATRRGGYQAEVCVAAATLARAPADLAPLDVAGLGLAAVTAFLALEVLDVSPGQRVLVHAGSSGVGSIALELIAARSAHVIASGTRPAKFELMRERGAREVIDSRDASWASKIEPVDRVFDLVGAATFKASVDRLAPGGRLVFVGGTSGGELALSGWDLMKPVTLTGYSSESLTQPELQRAIDAIAAAKRAGVLSAPEIREVPLRSAADAHRLLEAGEVAGRVLLRP
jgi:NADPH2:quinone reductase